MDEMFNKKEAISYVPMSADLIHHGHINVLKIAKTYGKVIVGLYSDSAIEILKGKLPVISYDDRKIIVENLKGVELVICQPQPDFTEALQTYKPDYVIHANNWQHGSLREIRDNTLNVLKEWGGKIIEPEYTETVSSTQIIKSIIGNNSIIKNYISKSQSLRKIIFSDKLEFLMEAHNGISSKIVENAGFKAIWASGLSISASLGVRDDNEASWSQVLDVLEFMSDSVNIPILVDGDTGYGNFNNARIFVRKLEQRGIGGVCFEDKTFPKTNSFIGDKQKLADIDEFCGKIRACKDYQINPYFVIVARLEAFIAGFGLNEALKRAYAYHNAGADAILVHSKISDSSDIDSFMKEWDNRCPIIIVPTKYYRTPTQHFRDIGISTVIWANHNMRTSMTAMQETTKQIFESESLEDVEKRIVTVKDVFELTGEDKLKNDEEKYSK
jgi:phosphoenolpyruvate mutase